MLCGRVGIDASLLTDEAHLFVEDHNPDPTLHSHLEHTNNKIEGVASGNEGSQMNAESDGNESDGNEEVGIEGEGVLGEGVAVEEDSNHELKENAKGFVKQKKRKGVRTVQRVIGAKPGEMDEEVEVSRCKVSRGRLVHRSRRVAMWQRVRLPAARIQRTSRKH